MNTEIAGVYDAGSLEQPNKRSSDVGVHDRKSRFPR